MNSVTEQTALSSNILFEKELYWKEGRQKYGRSRERKGKEGEERREELIY